MEEKPRVLVSKCIEFAACRYNGQRITSHEVKALAPFVEFIPVCPEVAVGLGVPRDAVRLIDAEGKIRLIQSESGTDHTEAMEAFTASFLKELQSVDGCILKGRSPTCGIGSVKVYPSAGKVRQLYSKGTGLFGQAVLDTFPEIPVEDEGRLNNLRLREHFFTALFTLHRFNRLPVKMGALVDFHSNNKYLFMSYSQRLLKESGRITANHDSLEAAEVFSRYRRVLSEMFQSLPGIQNNVNVLQHLLGYVTKEITREERSYFLETLDQYRSLRLPLSAVTSLLRSWVIRFDTGYLARQTYFQPFPKELQRIFDSSTGRV